MDDRKKQTIRRMKQLRGDLGLSQVEVAEKVGVAPSTISGIETGAQGISGIAEKLATALGTTTDYLYGLTDNPLPPDDEEDEDERQPANAARNTLLSEYDRLDEIDQQVLVQMAVTLRLAKERRRTQSVRIVGGD